MAEAKYSVPASILKEFSTCQFKLIQGGWQIKRNGATITFYPNKLKYNFKGQWGEYTKKGLAAIIIGHFKMIPTYSKDEEISEPVADNGVQKCIEHVLSKAAKIGSAKGDDHATAAMLKAVADELKQYLP